MQSNSILMRFFVVGLALVALPACIKYHDLVKSEFPQGESQPDQQAVAVAHRRSKVVYDEFSTKAIFDGLWLSDAMRTAYVDMYAYRKGLDAEAREARLKRQLEENRVWLNFYLLAEAYDKNAAQLNEKNSPWSVYAMIDDKHKLVPEVIKLDDELEPEFQKFFGPRFNFFKSAYLIKFRLTEGMAEHIASGKYSSIKLVIGSVYKKCDDMEWTRANVQPQKKVKDDKDIYWG